MSRILKNKKLIIALFTVIFVAGLFYFKDKSKDSTLTSVTTALVAKGSIVSSVSASGSVLTSHSQLVSTQASGLVSQVFVKEGDTVKKGQKLATLSLDQSGFQAQSQAYSNYLSAQKNLASAQNQLLSLESAMWSAHEKYRDTGWGRTFDDPIYIQTNRDWLAAEASYKNQALVISQAKAALSQAAQDYQLASSTITAPINGTISSLSVVAGMPVSSDTTQTIATIKQPGLPLVSVNVTEIDVNHIKPDQKATLTLDSIPDKNFTGTVLNVNRTGSVTNGVTQYPVILKLDDSDPDILPNMAATANIIIDYKSDILVVPSSAIQTQNQQDLVVVERDGQQQTVPVQIGLSSDTQTEIVSGLSEGDTIVINSLSAATSTSADSGALRLPGTGGGGEFIRMR